MYKECTVRLISKNEYSNRKELINKIEHEVLNGNYSPKPIHGFLSAPKANNVARFIPVLNYQDVSVYFGCVKTFDEDLAESAIEDTFGLWTLGGKRKEYEEKQAKKIVKEAKIEYSFMDDYAPISTYNRFAWVNNWGDYWKLMKVRYEILPVSFYFAMLDIANFYDTIDLPKLERELRKSSPNKNFAIDVCVFLLSNWNKKLTQYSRSTKGIPMDLIGDCSRILANFYLTPFDKVIREKSLIFNSQYIRYSDDMVFICPDKDTCKNLVFLASEELHKIGLNINVAKVRYFTKEEFEEWWGFSIHKKFDFETRKFDKKDLGRFVDGLFLLKEKWKLKGFGRKHTLLKQAINKLAKIKVNKQLNGLRKWIYETAFSEEDFILNLNERQIKNLIRISNNDKYTIESIFNTIMKHPYTSPKASLLRCFEDFRNNKNPEIRKLSNLIISKLRSLNNNILNLGINNMPESKYKD